MFKKVEPLTKDNHQDLRFTPVNNFSFAEKISTAPLSFSEIAVASKFYPIVFLKDAGLPAAILSLEKEKNGFVTPEGNWKVPYVPAHFRGYPFLLARMADAPESDKGGNSGKASGDSDPAKAREEKFLLCIDRDASHFAAPQGELMFTANGEFTDLVTKRLEFLKALQTEINTTSALVRIMREKDVLAERSFMLNVNGQNVPVGGFSVVDMQKVNALDDALLADWVRKGVIALIAAHLNSIAGIPMAQQ
ncbi:putative SapC family protein [Desulfamplus magnetovallimortis]|uniref:Putative SapC family protein n=1 Tax=Desulfamplus magnetovallimortis TaxID=1246637 RepID=A0A1W1HCY7_9BACT|nr:SapC family protein [Desulfamplus magnetovallimortis]SLM30361.1 putative SapC family protein [Desulfamplus magnetovallimortis]